MRTHADRFVIGNNLLNNKSNGRVEADAIYGYATHLIRAGVTTSLLPHDRT